MNWPVEIPNLIGVNVIQMGLNKIHSNPSSAQIACWNLSISEYLVGRYEIDYPIDGYVVSLYSKTNILFHPTKLQLTWLCIYLAKWPEELPLPDLLDWKAFREACNFEYCQYLDLYIHLITKWHNDYRK